MFFVLSPRFLLKQNLGVAAVLKAVWLRPRNVTSIGAVYMFEAFMKPFEAVLRPV